MESKILAIYTEQQHDEMLDEGWREIAAGAVIGAAAMNPFHATAKENLPQSYTQTFSADNFIKYLKSSENEIKSGFKDGKWYPHKSPEGGMPTIAYGHKIRQDELVKFRNGITDEEAEELLKGDINTAKHKAADDFKAMTGRNFAELPQTAQYMLIDIAFNLGTIKKFKNFTNALATGNIRGALSEYKRSYVDKKGNRKELVNRNAKFKSSFLDPWVVYIRSGFKPIRGPKIQKPTITKKIPLDINLADTQ